MKYTCSEYIQDESVFTIVHPFLFKDGVRHGKIIEKKGNNLVVRRISKNKYINGQIQEIIFIMPTINIFNRTETEI